MPLISILITLVGFVCLAGLVVEPFLNPQNLLSDKQARVLVGEQVLEGRRVQVRSPRALSESPNEHRLLQPGGHFAFTPCA